MPYEYLLKEIYANPKKQLPLLPTKMKLLPLSCQQRLLSCSLSCSEQSSIYEFPQGRNKEKEQRGGRLEEKTRAGGPGVLLYPWLPSR